MDRPTITAREEMARKVQAAFEAAKRAELDYHRIFDEYKELLVKEGKPSAGV